MNPPLAIVVTFFLQSYFVTGHQALQSLNPSFWGGAYNPTLVHYTPGNIALHLSFLFGLSPEYSRSLFLPDWSIGLEMQFYFIFPILILIMQRVGFTASAILIGVAAYYVGTYVAAHTHYLEPSLLIFSLNYFLAGMLIFRALRGQFMQHIIPMIGVFALILIDSKFSDPMNVMPILMASMLILGFMEKKNAYPAWLSSAIHSRFVRFFSDTSYGVYLFHGTFIALAGVVIDQHHSLQVMYAPYRVFLIFLFVGIGAYIAAFALHRLVELPGIAIGRKVIARMKVNRVTLPAKDTINREVA